jgi:hypothetical protein
MDFSAEAEILVAALGPSEKRDVFERNVFRSRTQRPKSASSSTSDTSTSQLADLKVRRIRESYKPGAWPPPSTKATHAAAASNKHAWQQQRLQNSQSISALGGEALRLVERFITGRGIQERSQSKAHLVVHFDINKTILMSDTVKGSAQADMINLLLSECAWGRMEKGPRWVPVGRLATDQPEEDPQFMTYKTFLESFLNPAVEGSLREQLRRKQLCSDLQKTFTHPGQPGLHPHSCSHLFLFSRITFLPLCPAFFKTAHLRGKRLLDYALVVSQSHTATSRR